MNLNSNNVCLNCENLAVNSICSKHNVEVSLDNYCDSHSFKKAHLKKSTWPSRSNLRFINLKTKKKFLFPLLLIMHYIAPMVIIVEVVEFQKVEIL